MPEDRLMVCGDCYQSFQASSVSWHDAEHQACPHCGSRETTPLLEARIGDRRLRHYSLAYKAVDP